MIADIQVRVTTHVNDNRARIAEGWADMITSLTGIVNEFRDAGSLEEQMKALDDLANAATDVSETAHRFFELLLAPTVARMVLL